MCVTDRHDMTLAVKVALNPNTTNNQQPTTDQSSYSPTILQNTLSLVLSPSLFYSAAFECKTTSDWLNRTVQPIRSCFTFKFTKSWRKRQRTFFRMVGEYGPRDLGLYSPSFSRPFFLTIQYFVHLKQLLIGQSLWLSQSEVVLLFNALKHSLSFSPRVFKFESNTTSDWWNLIV